jgi:catechol 2,3-dioxygenase-like lactoylglutathione lyase family enzyme
MTSSKGSPTTGRPDTASLATERLATERLATERAATQRAATQRAGAQGATKGTPANLAPAGILETVLYAEDLDAAETFYRDVLGFAPFAKVSGRHLFFRCGAQVLLIFNPNATTLAPPAGALPVPPHGAVGAGHICFRALAADLDAWRQRLHQKGIAIEADFAWPNGGRSIYFRDPAGNCLEFAEPRIWGLD